VIISTTYSSSEDQLLLLGPFHGKPACQEIRFGKGVCGTAAAKQETVVVPDVLDFPGHIACDAESRSEIVVPILVNGEVSTCFLVITHHAVSGMQFAGVHANIFNRLSLLLISTAPSPLDLTMRIRSTLRNWLPFWLNNATGKSKHDFFFLLIYNGYERHGLR
jgi:hypothetical protein